MCDKHFIRQLIEDRRFDSLAILLVCDTYLPTYLVLWIYTTAIYLPVSPTASSASVMVSILPNIGSIIIGTNRLDLVAQAPCLNRPASPLVALHSIACTTPSAFHLCSSPSYFVWNRTMESKKSSSKLTTSPSREQQLPTLPIPPIRIRCQHIELSMRIAPVNTGDGDVEVILVGMVIV